MWSIYKLFDIFQSLLRDLCGIDIFEFVVEVALVNGLLNPAAFHRVLLLLPGINAPTNYSYSCQTNKRGNKTRLQPELTKGHTDS
jgi:hypothetical protein